MKAINPFDQSYALPEVSSGSYLKLRQGKTKIRILDNPIAGWVYWTNQNRPVRLQSTPLEVPADIRRDENGKADRVKHFWAMIVWNYASESVCILEITQVTIQKTILALANSDWGSPLDYDIEITKTGEKLETEYTVLNLPPKPAPIEAIKFLKEKPINLMALFDGLDPFNAAPSNPPQKRPEDWRQWKTQGDAINWGVKQCSQSAEELASMCNTAVEQAKTNNEDWRIVFARYVWEIVDDMPY